MLETGNAREGGKEECGNQPGWGGMRGVEREEPGEGSTGQAGEVWVSG